MLKNLHTHFQGDTIEELTAMVEASESSAAHGEQRDSATSSPDDLLETKPQKELPRFDPAYDAGVESFSGQFEGEEQ